MRTFSRPLALALATLVATAPVVARVGSDPGGAESPQALVARLQAASAAQDMKGLFACLVPDARREMALMMVAGAGMMVGFLSLGGEMASGMAEGIAGEEMTAEQKATMEEQKRATEAKAAEIQRQYEAILERHGVTAMMDDGTPLPEEPAARSAALGRMFADTDEIALLGDLIGLMESLGEKDARPPLSVPSEVTDYRIDGDRATAKAGDETIEFVRVDGRWFVDPRPAADEQGEGAGASG